MKLATTGIGIALGFAGLIALRAFVLMLGSAWLKESFDLGQNLSFEQSLFGILILSLGLISFRTKIQKVG
jgi:hypothetical protein